MAKVKCDVISDDNKMSKTTYSDLLTTLSDSSYLLCRLTVL